MTLVINNLSYCYGRLQALREVSVRAAAGKITAVLGPNASGKSTLLKCMIGAQRPASGSVMIDGHSVHALTAKQAAARIAYVPQRSTVSAAFTVRQVVELGRYALPMNASKIDQSIQRLDLSDIHDRPYPRLSVGQQQRVTLARAVAQLEPNGCLALDEPTSAMDLQHVHSAVRLLRELADEGATVVIAMHDITLAAAIADDAWLLNDGRLEADGAVHEVLTIERLEQIFHTPFQWLHQPDGPARLLPQLPAQSLSVQATITSP